MSIKIITDSASDIPVYIQERYGVKVIPTPVVINEMDYFDGQTIIPETFYQTLRDGVDVKTYHINSSMFYDAFLPYAIAEEELIYICFSTGIAGTFNAANLAKEELLEVYPNFDLTIIDSKCASLGFGLVTMKACEMLENGSSKDDIVAGIQYHCNHMEQIFTVETLEYLFKGGRLSRTSAIAGGLLDIKPLIEVNEEGKLVSFEKVRGRNKSLKRLVEIVGERTDDYKQVVGLVHGDDKSSLDMVKKLLEEKYGFTEFVESYVGCAIGAHTGPGIIGIIFLDEESTYKVK